MVATQFIGVVLLADLVTGTVHWAEDTFGSEKTPVIGKWLIKPNLDHHRDVGAFVRKSWAQSSWDLAIAGAVLVGAAAWQGLLTWQLWLFTLLTINANQIHKWNHMRPAEVPLWVRTLQKLRVLQSRYHHLGHHRGEKDSRYCVITDYVNPVFDRLRIWRLMERVLAPVLGAPRSSQGTQRH